MARNGFELRLVRRDQRCTAILAEVGSFRVDEHRHAGFPAQGDHRGNVIEGAFAVIREHDRTGAVQRTAQRFAHRIAGHRDRVFLVKADQLLAATLHTGLGDSGPVFGGREGAANALLPENCRERIGCHVLANNANKAGLRAKRCEVHGNVGCPARSIIRLLDVHNGHRRFG